MFKPLIVDGRSIEGYCVDTDGGIWSNKRNPRWWRNMSPTTPCESQPYPRISIRIDGKSRSLNAHRIICESLVPVPVPNGVTKEEWDNTPNSVKRLITNTLQVNHIDHDRGNYHPSNLEWVTSKENHQKYQEHLTKQRRKNWK